MLRKLALGGIKSRLRDYTVLFSGLVIASAIFYMFMALATNKAFLTTNSPINLTPFIFMFGEVLLSIITLVYIVYANTFLMSMRQRDYAMFMMLGAKGRKIAELIFIETVTIGFAAAIIGIFLGMGLTQLAGSFLIGMLHATAAHFSAVWVPAILWTLGFFIVLFVLAALVNARRLLKTPMMTLLHEAQTPNRLKKNPLVLIFQAVLAVVLLAIGYWAMAHLGMLQLAGIGIALVTIVLGSYLLFDALLVWLLAILKKMPGFAAKGLHTFTLSQLSFRIRDYTKILAVVSLLFALALGAITVGLGFESDIPEIAARNNAYDVVTIDPNAKVQTQAQKLTGIKARPVYHEKAAGKTLYFNADEINSRPLEFSVYEGTSGSKIRQFNADKFNRQINSLTSQLTQFQLPADSGRNAKAVSAAEFAKIAGKARVVTAYQVDDFAANYQAISKLVAAQNRQYGIKDAMAAGQKLGTYDLINSASSGLAFMGFFLGLAFLAMLASTLMFKILSGASFDQKRYLMLQKIGVRPRLLRRSIRQEIGALFFFPGLLGVIHVLFGLKMFVGLLQHPYGRLLMPFGIFLVLYGAYYLLTAWLYEGLVINKELQ